MKVIVPFSATSYLPSRIRQHIESSYNTRGVRGADGWELDDKDVHVSDAPVQPIQRREWPLLAKTVAAFATAADYGVGDTVARNLSYVGADTLAHAYEKIAGVSCGCGDRQAKLNAMYPYKCDLTLDCTGCGNGDIALAAWIAEGHKRGGRRVGMIARDGYAQIVRMFGQVVVSKPGKHNLRMGNGSRSYADELRKQLRTPRATQWQAELPWQSEPVRPPAVIPQAEIDAVDAFLRAHNPDNRPVIVLYPLSAQMTRRWPLSCWLDLAFTLAGQYCVVALDGPGSEDVRPFPLWAMGMSWTWQAALQQRAALVIGNDSAGVHIAVTLGRPAIAIMGPTRAEVVFGHAMPQVVAGSTPCTGCHFSQPYSAACDKGCRSLFSVTTDQVLDAIANVLPDAPMPLAAFRSRFGWVDVPAVDAHNYTSDAEASALATLITHHGCETVLEIGTAEGRTAAQCLAACPAVTRWDALDVDPQAGWLAHDARYRLQLRSGSESVTGGYDCIFVDGDHSYAVAMADSRQALTQARKLVVWHDAGNVADVDRVLNELRREGVTITRIAGLRMAYCQMLSANVEGSPSGPAEKKPNDGL